MSRFSMGTTGFCCPEKMANHPLQKGLQAAARAGFMIP